MTVASAFWRVRACRTVALVLLLAARCSASPPSAPERSDVAVQGALTTDRTAYRLNGAVANITVRFTNTSQHPVYLSHCGQVIMLLVERLNAGGGWKRLFPQYCPAAVVVPAVAVAPGASHTILLDYLRGPMVTSEELTGTFRVRLLPSTKVDQRGYAISDSSDELETSPVFTISP